MWFLPILKWTFQVQTFFAFQLLGNEFHQRRKWNIITRWFLFVFLLMVYFFVFFWLVSFLAAWIIHLGQKIVNIFFPLSWPDCHWSGDQQGPGSWIWYPGTGPLLCLFHPNPPFFTLARVRSEHPVSSEGCRVPAGGSLVSWTCHAVWKICSALYNCCFNATVWAFAWIFHEEECC